VAALERAVGAAGLLIGSTTAVGLGHRWSAANAQQQAMTLTDVSSAARLHVFLE
jgi:hypothetical protein